VDDHRLFADALTLLLERDDRVVIVGTAPNAEHGIELAVANDAQVVVMDVSMPGIDGLEATRRLRAVKPDVAVIILSGTADFADAARAAGAAGYLTKGRIHDEVVEAILSAAGHHADDLPDGHGLAG
jgi:DNA-binding NarL/FixJ family response regulator